MKTRAKHMKSLGWLGMVLASVLLVASVAAAVEVGELAPDFTLRSTTGGEDQPEPVPGETVCSPRVL